jgi:hypothetical protein
MARTEFSSVDTHSAWRRLAFLAVISGCALLLQQSEAKSQVAPRGGRPAAPRNPTPTPPVAPAEIKPLPAEPEEGPPEKKYATLPVDEPQSRNKSKIGGILRAGKFASPEEQQAFDDFYTKYFLARWSLQGDVASLPARRQELATHFRNAKSGEVRDHLNQLVLNFLKKLVEGEFHPAVKVNALLMIGELNGTDAGGRGMPLPEALTFLIAEAENTKIPDGLRAAALIGIMRHAVAGVPSGDAQKAVAGAMLQLAGDVPSGLTPSGRAWIAAQAVEILAVLGSVGDDNAVFKALLKIVANSKLPILVRVAAADSLGRLNYSSATGINPVETAVALGQLAIDACAEEERLAEEAQSQPAKATSPPDMRRRMIHRLDAVLTALVGEDDKNPKGVLLLAKEAAQKTFLEDLQKAVKAAVDELDDKRQETDDMKPKVAGLKKNLEAWLQKKP